MSAARPRVFVSRRIPEEGLLAVAEFADADIWPDDLPPPRDELLRRVAGVDGLLALLTDRVDDELLDAAGPQLRVVSNYAVGFDNVDVPACTRRGVAVGNTPGVLTETTADLAFALLMAAARRLTEGYDYVRADRWKTWGPLLLQGTDVHHATLGIIGFGRIGREMARRASGFDMTVLYHDAVRASLADEAALRARSVPLDELLAASDFISLHVNLTPETRGMMGREAFREDEADARSSSTRAAGRWWTRRALYEALRDGVIGGAALDVTDPEPMRADDPLLTLPNCLVVPHIASASRATRARMAEIAAANLLAGLRGEALPAPVNPEVAPRR